MSVVSPQRSMAVRIVLEQHAQDAAILHSARTNLTGAPHVRLRHLLRFDERLEAHLDGLAEAGEEAWPVCEAALEEAPAGAVFTAVVRALSDRRPDRLGRLLALPAALPGTARELLSAFGWLEADALRGVVAELLASPEARARVTGIAACAMHRVDPGLIARRCLEDPDPAVRARAWRTAGEIGKRELVSTAAAAMEHEDPACRFWAAWSAVLLGDKQRGLEVIAGLASVPGPFRPRAFQLAVQAMGVTAAHELLQAVAGDPASTRWLIRGSGLAGDAGYVRWLMDFMADDRFARLAGEAFSFITGADLAWLDLERKPPENFDPGPNDDPNDPNVDMDEDEGLPWPDRGRIEAWWQVNGRRFQTGVRYFMGEPLNPDHCLRVLKDGYQRQRRAAALYLSLLNPGTHLFEWRAPARRQQRLLAGQGEFR